MSSITVFKDAVVSKFHNRKIFIKKRSEGGINITFANACDDANKPACSHHVVKGIVRVTNISLSDEAMDNLISAYITFRKKGVNNG